MKAAQYSSFSGPIEIKSVPRPTLSKDHGDSNNDNDNDVGDGDGDGDASSVIL